MPKTNDALKIVDHMIGDDSQLQKMCQQATIDLLQKYFMV